MLARTSCLGFVAIDNRFYETAANNVVIVEVMNIYASQAPEFIDGITQAIRAANVTSSRITKVLSLKVLPRIKARGAATMRPCRIQ